MDKAEFAFEVMFVGFFVVLFTLLLLYILISVFGRILSRSGNESKSVTPPRQIALPTSGDALSPRVTAAVTAAVYAYLHEAEIKSSGIKLTIRKNTGGHTSGWAAAGRKSQLEKQWELELLRRKRLHEKV